MDYRALLLVALTLGAPSATRGTTRGGRHLEALPRRTLSPRDIEAAGDLARVSLDDAAHIRAAHRAGATGGPGRRFGVSIRPSEAPPPLAVPVAA